MALLLLLCSQVVGDSLSQLPAAWQSVLLPVPKVDLSGAEARVRQTIVEARKELTQLLAKPGNRLDLAAAYGHLGALYQAHQIPAVAETCYRNAQALDPEAFRWHYYAGHLALQGGRAKEAQARFARAEQIDAHYAPLGLRQGQAAYNLNQLDSAQRYFLSARHFSGLEALAEYYLGQIALLRREYDPAIEYFERALALDPKADRVHYPLAQAFRALGKQDLARDHLTRHGTRLPLAEDPLLSRLDALNSGARPHFLKGLNAVRERDYATAVDTFRQGLELEPGNLAARTSFARALFLAGQPDRAQQELESILVASKENPLPHFLLGILLQTQGKDAASVAQYQRTLTLDNKHAGAHLYLANQLFQTGQYEQAAEHYAQASTNDPDIVIARLLRIVALYHAGNPEKTLIGQLKAILQERPEDPQTLYALARLLAASTDPQIKDTSEAMLLAQRLLRLAYIPPYIETLAFVHAAKGEFTQALKLIRQLLPPPGWSLPVEQVEYWQNIVSAYEQETLPGPAWTKENPLLSPGPTDAFGPFQEYPTAVPF